MTAQAETLFREGIRLMDAGNFADACKAFDASERIQPAIATVLNQGDCREKNGQLATAWGLFLDAERQTRAATDDVAHTFHDVAARHATSLEPRLSRLTVAVPTRTPGLELFRDGAPIDPGLWDHALPVDGGSHEIKARAAGYEDWTGTIEVGSERDVTSIEVPPLKAAPKPPPKPTAPPPSPARSPVVPIALAGGSLVLVGSAIALSISGNHTYDLAKVEPDDAKQNDLWQSANHKRYAAEAVGIAGIGCAGAAAWLYLRHDSTRDTRPLAVVPTGNGLALVGSY
jgi:hypothetical protein